MTLERSDLVIVSNRLPVDISLDESGEVSWQRSPAGGLVTALEPVVRSNRSAWVGWPGSPDIEPPSFDADGIAIVPVPLSTEDLEDFYEGFSNDTLWPLYHDVIAAPSFHRNWWDAYVRVNRRYAEAAASIASDGAVVWVQDYQLQLVPKMIRELRADVKIGFFNHIPFPPVELFKQLPWRRQILEGLLGADLVGFQRASGASNFLRAVRNVLGAQTRGQLVSVDSGHGLQQRTVRAGHFPISIDSNRVDRMARSPEIKQRAAEIRKELGDPEVMFLGVDRLDYTKGIRHRIKAYGELLADGEFLPPKATFVQVASPSRENVEAYQQLRDEVEVLVTRINGDYGELGQPAIHYLHHSYPHEEMIAMYEAADIMLVTALRDGMNLVAKEYVASKQDDSGALVLSEFTGAADELKRGAVMVNPHDIDGLKAAMRRAASMSTTEAKRRMRRMRRQVLENDVERWSRSFLTALSDVSGDSLRWLQTRDENPRREDSE